VPGLDELARVLSINSCPLGLEVWAVWTADFGSLVPLEAGPFEVAAYSVEGAGDGAPGVGVFDPEQELPAGRLREEVVEERGAQGAEV